MPKLEFDAGWFTATVIILTLLIVGAFAAHHYWMIGRGCEDAGFTPPAKEQMTFAPTAPEQLPYPQIHLRKYRSTVCDDTRTNAIAGH